jgi:PKD repeat protein
VKSLVRALRRGRTQTTASARPRRRDRSRGQSLVEFAIILPVLLLMVLAALDLGRVFMGWVALNNAARVGANYAALHAGNWSPAKQATYESLVKDARKDAASAVAGCDTAAVPAPSYPGGTDIGDFAEVVLTCDFQPITPLIGDVFASTGAKFIVSATSVFPIRTGLVAGEAGSLPQSCLSSFTWTPTNPVAGEPVSFTDQTPPTASGWAWTFGDGTGAVNLATTSHSYANAGTYTVTLGSRSNGTSCTPSQVDIGVTEPPPPPPPPPPGSCQSSFTWTPTTPVAGEPVEFVDSTPPVASDWEWTFGDGAESLDPSTTSHIYTAAGTYPARLNSRSDDEACAPYEVDITVTEPLATGCVVPGFTGTQYYDAQTMWEDARFTTDIDIAPGDKKNQDWTIQWQSIVGGQETPCNVTITVSADEPKAKKP